MICQGCRHVIVGDKGIFLRVSLALLRYGVGNDRRAFREGFPGDGHGLGAGG